MGAIDIGPGATDRTTTNIAGSTHINLENPANDTGTLTSFEIWVNTNCNNVKIGTFVVNGGDPTKYTGRDYETVGSVTSGSKQTFSGLDCTVVTGDYLGVWYEDGAIEYDISGKPGIYYKSGDQFGAGEQTYALHVGDSLSIYGTGTTGWANIAKVMGATATDLAKVNGVAVADIAKMNGVAV